MISVFDSRELQAASLALKGMERGLRNEISRATRATFSPVWQREVASRASSAMDNAVLVKGTRLAGGNPPTLLAATSNRRLRGGLVPSAAAGAWEFGSGSRSAKRKYTGRSPKGTAYPVYRRTQRQVPARAASGRVVYPAFAEVAPRIAALWTQLIVRKTFDAIERRG